jgi:RHS repeat-associated protein
MRPTSRLDAITQLKHSTAMVCVGVLLTASLSVRAERVDPAPLPAEVTDRIKREVSGKPDHFQRRMSIELDDLETRLQRHERGGFDRGGNDRRALTEKAAELRAARAGALNKIVEQQALLERVGAKGPAARLDEIRKRVESRFGRLQRAVQDLEAVREAANLRTRARDVRNVIAELRPIESLFGEHAPNHSPIKERPSSPQIKSPVWPRYMAWQREPIRYASADGPVLAVLDPPPAAADCGQVPADLDKNTIDAKVTPEIAALAESLEYSPARIFAYVLNNIRHEWYWGSLKGAQGTLHGKAGGPTDQASLLIALLRESNIPARYVRGTAEFSDDRGLRWVGAKTYAAAAKLLSRTSNPFTILTTDAVGTVVGMAFAHVWVEACVPYANYRGTRTDATGYRWIPLDPSFKDKTYQAGIGHATEFDYSGYMAERTDLLPGERFAEQVEAAVKSLPPRFANNTAADVPYVASQIRRNLDILPSSLPYHVRSFDVWDVGATAEVAALPASHRYQVIISVANQSNVPLLSTPLQLNLPDVVLKRLTLGWKGATAGDQSALNSWKNQSPTSGISCSINVVPEIKGDGVVLASGSQAVGLCTVANRLAMEVKIGDFVPNGASFANIGAANLHSLQVYAYQASDRLIKERAGRLLDSVRSTSAPNGNTDEVLGEYLHVAGLKFMRYASDASRSIGLLAGGTDDSVGLHIGVTSSQMRVEYLFDLPFAVHRTGLLIDVPAYKYASLDPSTGEMMWSSFLLSGYSSSAHESYIWQENARMDAVSSVRGIQFAREQGIEVLEVTQANWVGEKNKLTTNADANLNYSSTDVGVIEGLVNQGHKVTLPRSLIQYGDWRGAVYNTEKNDPGDPGNTSAGFMIGKYAGGYTIGETANFYYTQQNPYGYVGDIPTTFNDDPAPLLINSAHGFGDTFYTIKAADPVNMVNGNMFHVERDISIKGRGLPIVFERFYNSRSPKNGPLGFGWTHSFNHTLEFIDDNVDRAVNAADNDGVTSAAMWTDGTGNQKFIVVSGASAAGVPIGAGFSAPKGFFFQAARQPNGTYTIREKNGLTYTFESTGGTVGQIARVIKIADRYGNALNLTYSASKLTAVADSLGRTLAFVYDGTNRITEVRDWASRVFRYEYDAAGNLVSFRNPLAVAGKQAPVTYEYYADASVDAQGNPSPRSRAMKKYTLPRGNSMTFEYYADGRVFKHYNSLGETTTFTYNSFRRESVEIGPRGYTRRYFFDLNGNAVRIVEPNGGERTYSYDCPEPDSPGNCPNPFNQLAKRDALGYETSYEYDALGNVTKIVNPSGSTIEFSHFTSFAQPGKVKDARGNYTLNKYDAQGNLLQEIKLKSGFGAAVDPATYVAVPSELIAWTINSYDGFGNVVSTKRISDFATQTGPTISYTYDSQNLNPVSVSRTGILGSGLQGVELAELTHDSLGRQTAGIRPDWYPVQAAFDEVDRVVEATDKIGNLRRFAYDANGNMLADQIVAGSTITDNLSFSYDQSDRRIQTVNSGGYATRYAFDQEGNITKVTDPDGYSVELEYDAANRLIRAQNEQGHAVKKELDLEGKPRAITDPNGHTVTYAYYGPEREGKVKRIDQPVINGYSSGRSVEHDYDAAGNVVKTTDIPGAPITGPPLASRDKLLSYDELNRLVRAVGPAYTDSDPGSGTFSQSIRPVTIYQHDTLGNVVQISAGRTDATGTNPSLDVVTVQMSYTYDDFGRQLSRTDPLGRTWTFRYDRFGNMVQSTDARGQVLHYAYEYGGRVQCVNKNSPNVNCTAGQDLLIKYQRDALGLVTEAFTPGVTYTYTYDAARRIESVTDSRGPKILVYEWSDAGRLNRMNRSDVGPTDYLYDPVGRLMGLWAPNYDFIAFQWDPSGRLFQKWFPNGVATKYSWNPDGTLAALTNEVSGEAMSQQTYTYDGFGRRVRNQETVWEDQPGYTAARDWTYTYDQRDQLLQAIEATTGNNAVFAYDVWGNLKRETYPAAAGDYFAYSFDVAHQMNGWETFNSSGVSYGSAYIGSMVYDSNGSMTSITYGTVAARTFAYDPLGQMSGTAANYDPADQSYTYDHAGRRVAKSVAGSVPYTVNYLYDGDDISSQYGAWNAAPLAYTYGPGVDDPLMAQEPDLPPKYYHADGLGSIAIQSSSTSEVHTVQRYDAWGGVTDASQSISTYSYTGREYDGTGLLYYRARYYYPELRRFIQRDPIGLADGINPYAYVGNNPTNLTDPTGLVARASGTFNRNDLFEAQNYIGGDNANGALTAAEQNLGRLQASQLRQPWEQFNPVSELADAMVNRVMSGATRDDISRYGTGGFLYDMATVPLMGVRVAASAGRLLLENAARGNASELRVLQELGLHRNNMVVSTAEGRAIPDALTNTLSIEIKDATHVYLTRQLRIQTEAARASGRQSVLITGENTCVSGPCSRAFDTIMRRSDLGPR